MSTRKSKIIKRVIVLSVTLLFVLGILSFVFFNGNAIAKINGDGNLVVYVNYFGSADRPSLEMDLDWVREHEIQLHTNFTRGRMTSGFSNLSVASGHFSGGDIYAIPTIGFETYEFHANLRVRYVIVLLLRSENRAIVFNDRTSASTRELYNKLRGI